MGEKAKKERSAKERAKKAEKADKEKTKKAAAAKAAKAKAEKKAKSKKKAEKALKEKHEKKVEKTKKAEAEKKKKAAKKEKSMKEKHTKKVKAEKAKKETKKKAAEKKEKAKPYKTIRSDGSSPTKPACSWNSKCKWNAESKDKCATQICQLNGYKKGKFIKTFGKSNNMCKQSATSKSVWNLSYDKPGKPVKGSWGSEAFFEVGCGTNHPGVTIKTDGSQKKPYCSWNSKCKWNAAAKAACAKKMCQLNGFKKGKFIWASNNMCKVSATSKSVWNLSWDKPGKPVKGSWGSEAAIEAKCS